MPLGNWPLTAPDLSRSPGSSRLPCFPAEPGLGVKCSNSDRAPSSPLVIHSIPAYTVRCILDVWQHRQGLHLLVDWEGYNSEEKSWVPWRKILDEWLLQNFSQDYPDNQDTAPGSDNWQRDTVMIIQLWCLVHLHVLSFETYQCRCQCWIIPSISVVIWSTMSSKLCFVVCKNYHLFSPFLWSPCLPMTEGLPSSCRVWFSSCVNCFLSPELPDWL